MEFRSGYTKIENYFLDYVMPRVSCAEWKVICAVLRETVGWNRNDAEITLDRFIELTGFARQAVVAAIMKACRRTVVERRTVQVGRQRTFRYQAVTRANLKPLPKPDARRHQSALPFDVTEFENHTPSTKFDNQTPMAVTEYENQTPIAPVLRSIKTKDLRETRTQIARATPAIRQTPVENSAAKPRVCGSKFTKKQIRRYAWASHNFDQFLIDYYSNRGQNKRASVGIQNPEGWATAAKRTGEHDDEIQEWIDDPLKFDADTWVRANRRVSL